MKVTVKLNERSARSLQKVTQRRRESKTQAINNAVRLVDDGPARRARDGLRLVSQRRTEAAWQWSRTAASEGGMGRPSGAKSHGATMITPPDGPGIVVATEAEAVAVVAAHDQKITHNYTMHYPPHPARKDDPHYRDFNAYHRKYRKTAKCSIGEHRDDYSECSGGPLELHHSHVEFSLQNGVDLRWLEKDYPGISDPDIVGAWVETAANLMWLCMFHHRGHGGVHVAAASDYEAGKYVRGLFR